MKKYSSDDAKKVLKAADSWWTVLIVDPIAVRLALFFANFTPLTPNFFSGCTIALSIVSGFLFAKQHLIYGALVYEIAFIFDCIDGKVATLKGLSSDFGMWIDSMSDKVRLLAAVLGLSIGFPEMYKLAIVFVALYLWDETESALFSRMEKKAAESSGPPAEGANAPPLIRFRDWLRRRRISGPLSLVEQDTVAFLVMPLLGMPVLGMKLAIAMNLAGRAITILHFWLWRYRRN
jgi:phosphatidylglycerophosphate synthase